MAEEDQVRFDVPVPGLVELSAEAFCRLLNKPGAGFEHVDWSDTVHDAMVDDGHWWVGGRRGSSCAEQYHYRKFKTECGWCKLDALLEEGDLPEGICQKIKDLLASKTIAWHRLKNGMSTRDLKFRMRLGLRALLQR